MIDSEDLEQLLVIVRARLARTEHWLDRLERRELDAPTYQRQPQIEKYLAEVEELAGLIERAEVNA